jgi:hypothetical protein
MQLIEHLHESSSGGARFPHEQYIVVLRTPHSDIPRIAKAQTMNFDGVVKAIIYVEGGWDKWASVLEWRPLRNGEGFEVII